MKIIIFTLFLLLIAGCKSPLELPSGSTDAYVCFRVYYKYPLGYLATKEYTKKFLQTWEDEMKARNLNCAEEFPSGGYEGPTSLEILLQEE